MLTLVFIFARRTPWTISPRMKQKSEYILPRTGVSARSFKLERQYRGLSGLGSLW